jgi:cation transporter-like permease
MNKKVSSDDASILLYMVPFIASGVYALYLWVGRGISFVLPSSVYLTVTRDPILFLVGTFSVMLGVVLEVSSTGPSGRSAKLGSVGSTLQTIALASFILAFVCAFYAHGFYDFSGAVSDFIVGRFSIIFPVMIILFSYLASARFNLSSIRTPTVLGIVAMLLSPASLYAIGRRNSTLGFVVALAFLLAGLGLFLMPSRKVADQEKGSGADQ